MGCGTLAHFRNILHSFLPVSREERGTTISLGIDQASYLDKFFLVALNEYRLRCLSLPWLFVLPSAHLHIDWT